MCANAAVDLHPVLFSIHHFILQLPPFFLSPSHCCWPHFLFAANPPVSPSLCFCCHWCRLSALLSGKICETVFLYANLFILILFCTHVIIYSTRSSVVCILQVCVRYWPSNTKHSCTLTFHSNHEHTIHFLSPLSFHQKFMHLVIFFFCSLLR